MGAVCCKTETNSNPKSEKLLDDTQETHTERIEVVQTKEGTQRHDDELILLTDSEEVDIEHSKQREKDNTVTDSDDTEPDRDGQGDADADSEDDEMEMGGMELNNGHTPKERTQSNLVSLDASKFLDESQTEVLERQLKKEINKMSSQEIDHDDAEREEDEDESDISSLDMDGNEEEAKHERRESNLFRARSRSSWNSGDLDDQETALREQIMLLQQSQSKSIDHDESEQ